ncbi:antitoxin Xre/MbcA/ParS toxin-binding domain-containing protein [Stutzerimonas frequens]|uniref:antitoxin Xre/MbcA/ParS toxin-binding domain-containing protein n=1 Tax=Stutzerimonas frequens TaxID=2968969 RepID=UPI002110808A|nr:antitoxin Xre/MbcA/ParS toxin-binding domain-containing protein [Stutzerimonas frequens]|tara:strand:+ start:2869 stop:3105 length:237 start_codon:yes stop_codon:yes gene_type:complete
MEMLKAGFMMVRSALEIEIELRKAATDLFAGDEQSATEWLNKPAKALNGRKPIDMTNNHAELSLVLDLIGRLQHGVFT